MADKMFYFLRIYFVSVLCFVAWDGAWAGCGANEATFDLDLSLEHYGVSTNKSRAFKSWYNLDTLRDFETLLSEKGPLMFEGVPKFGPAGLKELEAIPAIKWVFARGRLNPALIPLYSSTLSARARNALQQNNIWNLLELRSEYQRLGRSGLMRIPNIGDAVIEDIEIFLASYNIHLLSKETAVDGCDALLGVSSPMSQDILPD